MHALIIAAQTAAFSFAALTTVLLAMLVGRSSYRSRKRQFRPEPAAKPPQQMSADLLIEYLGNLEEAA